MPHDHPPTQPPTPDRFFGRIYTFSLECPACTRIHLITRSTPSAVYNRRTGLFRCHWCRHLYALGLIAYPVLGIGANSSRGSRIPDDWTPTPREALAIRQYYGQNVYGPRAQKTNTTRNVKLPACRCTVHLDPDPACVMHGRHIALSPRPRKTQDAPD